MLTPWSRENQPQTAPGNSECTPCLPMRKPGAKCANLAVAFRESLAEADRTPRRAAMFGGIAAAPLGGRDAFRIATMLLVLEESDGLVLGVRVNGRITRPAFDEIAQRSEHIIEEYGSLRLLVHLQSFPAMDLSAFCADIRFSLRHFGDLDRLALVGDARWHAAYVAVLRPFVPAQLRHYRCRDIDKAWQWLFEGNISGLRPLRVDRPRRPLKATTATLA